MCYKDEFEIFISCFFFNHQYWDHVQIWKIMVHILFLNTFVKKIHHKVFNVFIFLKHHQCTSKFEYWNFASNGTYSQKLDYNPNHPNHYVPLLIFQKYQNIILSNFHLLIWWLFFIKLSPFNLMIQGLILFPNHHLLLIIDEKKDVITKKNIQTSLPWEDGDLQLP